MFKFLTILVILVTLTACDVIKAPSTNDLMPPTHAYEIDTWGGNSEIYEFTPKSAPNKICIMFMLDSGKAMGLQCFDK